MIGIMNLANYAIQQQTDEGTLLSRKSFQLGTCFSPEMIRKLAIILRGVEFKWTRIVKSLTIEPIAVRKKIG